jgi:hypothetical protein
MWSLPSTASRDLFGSSPAQSWDWLTKLVPGEGDKLLKIYDMDLTQQKWEEMVAPPSTGHKVVVLDLSLGLNSTDYKGTLSGDMYILNHLVRCWTSSTRRASQELRCGLMSARQCGGGEGTVIAPRRPLHC